MRRSLLTIAVMPILWLVPAFGICQIAPDVPARIKPNRIPDAVQEAFGKLHVGMTFQEVENTIRPVLLDSGRQLEGGSGHSTRVYHLRGDWQFTLRCDGYPRLDNVIEIHELEPKKPWRGFDWKPGEKDKATAVKIAADALRNEIKAGRDPSANFPTDPGGRRVFDDNLRIELEIKPGTKTTLTAVAGEGRWESHKLVRVNFLREDTWLYQVAVDMNEQKAVPSNWTPTEQDIAKGRAIADPSLGEFLGSDLKQRSMVKVEAWGGYDYGPLRRLLVLVYIKPDDGAQSLKFVVIDFEKGKLDDR